MYKQARKGVQQLIKANKSKVFIESTSDSMIEDAYGQMIPDPDGVKVGRTITCRISYLNANTNGLITAPTGYSTDFVKIINTDYKTPIYKGDRFDDYEVGPVYEQTVQGHIIGYQAELKEASK